jgi:hypothetical protein
LGVGDGDGSLEPTVRPGADGKGPAGRTDRDCRSQPAGRVDLRKPPRAFVDIVVKKLRSHCHT